MRSQAAGVGVADGAPVTASVSVAVSAVAPGTAEASAPIVSVQVPAVIAVRVNAAPDGCAPGGFDEQTGSVICCTSTGTDEGVPGATPAAFVNVACAVNDAVPPTEIVAAPADAVTW